MCVFRPKKNQVKQAGRRENGRMGDKTLSDFCRHTDDDKYIYVERTAAREKEREANASQKKVIINAFMQKIFRLIITVSVTIQYWMNCTQKPFNCYNMRIVPLIANTYILFYVSVDFHHQSNFNLLIINNQLEISEIINCMPYMELVYRGKYCLPFPQFLYAFTFLR